MNFRGVLALLTLVMFLAPGINLAVGQYHVSGHVTKK